MHIFVSEAFFSAQLEAQKTSTTINLEVARKLPSGARDTGTVVSMGDETARICHEDGFSRFPDTVFSPGQLHADGTVLSSSAMDGKLTTGDTFGSPATASTLTIDLVNALGQSECDPISPRVRPEEDADGTRVASPGLTHYALRNGYPVHFLPTGTTTPTIVMVNAGNQAVPTPIYPRVWPEVELEWTRVVSPLPFGRVAKLNSTLGGGSMTALPIVETQEGDISLLLTPVEESGSQLHFSLDHPNPISPGNSGVRVGSGIEPHLMKQVVGRSPLKPNSGAQSIVLIHVDVIMRTENACGLEGIDQPLAITLRGRGGGCHNYRAVPRCKTRNLEW